MKKAIFIGLTVLSAAGPVFGVIMPFSYTGGPYSVPDGNPNGVSSSIIVAGANASLTDLSVTVNLNGGYNGDLYAYLSFNGQLVPLLNRVGLSSGNVFGWNGAGMTITLSDNGVGNVHAAGNGFLNGIYRPDGQNINPLSAPSSFNANGGSITLNGVFGGMNPNGEWTLFIADVVSSGTGPTVNGWSLGITAVPEPSAICLGLLGIAIHLLGRRRPTPGNLPLPRL